MTASWIFSPLGFIQSNGTVTFAHSSPGSHGAQEIAGGAAVTPVAAVVTAVVADGSDGAALHAAATRASTAAAATTAARVRGARLACQVHLVVVTFMGAPLGDGLVGVSSIRQPVGLFVVPVVAGAGGAAR
jgi:hypothetical protein